MDIQQIQVEQERWSQYNFGEQPAYYALLGAMEELGELCHAHLKMAQGIRTHENHHENAQDAIGDVVIYLMDYCWRMGFDFGKVLETTWKLVRQRDWVSNPRTGGSNE